MSFFSFFSKKEKSGQIAKNRLQLLLVHDRMKLAPESLEALKHDLLKAISTYLEIDEGELNVELGTTTETPDGKETPALMLNLPVKGWKRS